jgi:hypothetical protein
MDRHLAVTAHLLDPRELIDDAVPSTALPTRTTQQQTMAVHQQDWRIGHSTIFRLADGNPWKIRT